MTERNIMAVVTDLIKSGLSVEQSILVNELVIVAANEQRAAILAAIPRSYERERKRAYRDNDVPDCPGQRKEPKESNIYISNPEGESEGEPMSRTSPAEPLFEQFWEVYPRKVGKGAARKAYRHALKRASHAEILAGAKRYKPDPQFTRHPTTWLNADCWLDEPDKPKSTVTAGPWKKFAPEPPRKPRTPEEQAAIDELVRKAIRRP